MNHHKRAPILCLAILLLAPAAGFAGEGFGWPKKRTVQLQRQRPADVYLAGTRIAIRPSGKGGDVERQLSSWLESELLRNDSRLEVAEPPDTEIEVEVLQDDHNASWENRTVTKQVEAGKDSKGKTIWRSQEVSVRYEVIHYLLSVSYKVTDAHRGASLDSGNLSFPFDKDYEEGHGAPERSALVGMAISNVSSQIARRLTPTAEQVGVLLPQGSLKELARLAEANLWDRYLEGLERLPRRPDREDESYRQFALGIAYEALGYRAEDTETALRYLEQASTHYNAAVEGNPGEKYFTQSYDGGFVGQFFKGERAMAPMDRVRSALVQYQRLVELQQLQDEASTTVASTAGSKGTLDSSTGGNPGSDALTNRSVIEMSQAGLPEDVILTAVKSAPSTAFDLSPTGLVELARGKVSHSVIQQLQTLAGASKPKGK